MRRVRALLAFGLLLCASGAGLGAQTAERLLFVSVVDQAGAPVAGLGAEEFIVREDGQPREVLRVTPATQPITMAVLVDNSEAIGRYITDIREGLKAFLTRIVNGENEVGVIGLADRPTILQEYTTSRSLLARVPGRIFAQPGSGTMLLDAVVDTSRGLQKRQAERRAIVIITSEGTDFSNPDYRRALEMLHRGEAALYALVITEPGSSGAAVATEEGRNRGIVLDEGTSSTGGRVAHLVSSMALTSELARLATELERQYTVVYARPGALVPPEKITVGVNRPHLRARGTPAAGSVRSSAGN
jgi:VWFA-related protein